jgi:hypothetical protein
MKNNNRKEIDCNLFFRNISLKWLGIISFFLLKIFLQKTRGKKNIQIRKTESPYSHCNKSEMWEYSCLKSRKLLSTVIPPRGLSVREQTRFRRATSAEISVKGGGHPAVSDSFIAWQLPTIGPKGIKRLIGCSDRRSKPLPSAIFSEYPAGGETNQGRKISRSQSNNKESRSPVRLSS